MRPRRYLDDEEIPIEFAIINFVRYLKSAIEY